MIDELKRLLPNFMGRRGHVWCMAHTVNLSAKGILRPFELKNCKKDTDGGSNDSGDGDEDAELLGLGDGVEIEELQAELHNIEEHGVQDKDDIDGFVDVLQEMTVIERKQWAKDVAPLRSALVKVSSLLFTNRIGFHPPSVKITQYGNFEPRRKPIRLVLD